MISLARNLRIDVPRDSAWSNLNDLEGFSRFLPALDDVRCERDSLSGGFRTRAGLWSIAGQLRLQVVERLTPNRLRLEGNLALDEGGTTSRFDVVWFLEPEGAHATRASYVLRIRSSPVLERLASMTLSRKAHWLDRRVVAALGREARGAASAGISAC